MQPFSSIRKYSTLNRLRPNTASQIFDTMIFPILSYNSELWGMYTKQDFKTWDRSPILGRLPLVIPINQRIMK